MKKKRKMMKKKKRKRGQRLDEEDCWARWERLANDRWELASREYSGQHAAVVVELCVASSPVTVSVLCDSLENILALSSSRMQSILLCLFVSFSSFFLFPVFLLTHAHTLLPFCLVPATPANNYPRVCVCVCGVNHSYHWPIILGGVIIVTLFPSPSPSLPRFII